VSLSKINIFFSQLKKKMPIQITVAEHHESLFKAYIRVFLQEIHRVAVDEVIIRLFRRWGIFYNAIG
jgi:hypothetical protein